MQKSQYFAVPGEEIGRIQPGVNYLTSLNHSSLNREDKWSHQ